MAPGLSSSRSSSSRNCRLIESIRANRIRIHVIAGIESGHKADLNGIIRPEMGIWKNFYGRGRIVFGPMAIALGRRKIFSKKMLRQRRLFRL
jgi:hypothetical protein